MTCVCVCLGAGGVRGKWARGLDLGFTNPGGTGGKWDMQGVRLSLKANGPMGYLGLPDPIAHNIAQYIIQLKIGQPIITIMNRFNIIVQHTIKIFKYHTPCRQMFYLHFCSTNYNTTNLCAWS